MVRAMRLRKPHTKYPEEEYELNTSLKKSPVRKIGTEEKSAVPKGSRSGLTKGNLNTGWRTLKGTRTAVLRDRTNLHEEPLKVDLLIKQGTGRGSTTKSTKSSGNTRSKTSEENGEGKVEGTSSVGGTKKRRKLENGKESTSGDDLKDRKEIQSDNEETDETVIAPKRGAKIVKKSIKTLKSGTTNAEIAKRPTRKGARKVNDEENESADENSDEKANSPDSKPQDSAVAIKRPANNQDVAKKTGKNTRKVVKSTASEGNDDPKLVKTSSSKPLRKTTRKLSAERESPVDTDLATGDIPENDENQESEVNTDSVGTTKRSGRRVTSRKISMSKKTDENVDSAKKTPRRLPRLKVNEQEKKAAKDLDDEKKFFKSKTAGKPIERQSPIKRTVIAKLRNIGNPRLSVSFRSRQTTLQESFAKQTSRKVLRPRKSQKNYCEETMVEKREGKKTGDGIVERKKIGPVYKSAIPEEDSVKDKNAVYDFQFDSNDSRERLPKKKRKRNLRKNIATKKVVKTKKTTSSLQPRDNLEMINSKATTGQAGIEKIDVVELVSIQSEKPTKSREMEINDFPVEINDTLENEQTEKVDELATIEEKSSNIVTGQKVRPRIVESIELKGNECLALTTTPVLTKSSDAKVRNHLRPAKQFRTILSHAFLNKSISPIIKAIENFDPGSPWRPPVFANQDFSRVKNIVQSTPRERNFAAILQNATAKTTTGCNIETKKVQITEKEEVAKVSKIPDKQTPIEVFRLSKSPRKFGTVISNLNNEPVAATRILESNKKNSTDTDSKTQKIDSATTETPKIGSAAIETRLAITGSQSITDDLVETMNFANDDHGDKENSLPVVPSPKRSPLKSLNRAPFGNLNNSPPKNLNRSPLKNLNRSPLKNLNRSPLKSLNRLPLENLNRSPIKSLNRSPLENLQKSPLKDPKKILAMLRAKKMQNENMEPQAGPSNEKMMKPLDDSRILRQSNLDNYLNLDEMPKSTRISTAHGIFDDAHSTPISGKPAKKIVKDSNVENAFGFDVSDEDLENDISPIKKFIPENPLAKRGLTQAQLKVEEQTKISAPARFSIEEIKKHLLPLQKQEKVKKQAPVIERLEEEDEGEEKSDNKNKREYPRVQKIADPVDCPDTFDVSENPENNEESVAEVELFADMEPLHFKQAPRYSYKRKRVVGFIFSDEDEDSENAELVERRAPKRQKISKAERERKKKMDNWAKDLNQTFEEIEHFDLVVE